MRQSRLFIPPLKTELELADDWTFKLYKEHRNEKLIKAFADPSPLDDKWYWWTNWETQDVTLWVETVLIVDRIYIKQNQPTYDSITFRVKSSPQFEGKPRFWAKLSDVNKMVVFDVAR